MLPQCDLDEWIKNKIIRWDQSWCENILLQPLSLNKKDSLKSWVYVQHNFTSIQQKLTLKKLKHWQNKSLFL